LLLLFLTLNSRSVSFCFLPIFALYSRFTRSFFFFFFNDTATTEIYTLSLHDALPIYWAFFGELCRVLALKVFRDPDDHLGVVFRSEEHTSELQSRGHLVCRLLLEKKKITLRAQPFDRGMRRTVRYVHRVDEAFWPRPR